MWPRPVVWPSVWPRPASVPAAPSGQQPRPMRRQREPPARHLSLQWEVSRLPGSLSAAEFEAQRADFEGKTVVCYCTVGYRSSAYAAKLRQQGWEAKNLEGGVIRWVSDRPGRGGAACVCVMGAGQALWRPARDAAHAGPQSSRVHSFPPPPPRALVCRSLRSGTRS